MQLIEYFRKNETKLMKSSLCFLAFMGLGGCCTLLGSSLLDLQIQLQVKFVTVSQLIPSRALGYLCGGIMCGFLESLASENMILFVTNVIAGIFIALAPWFKSIYGTLACFFISGISQGIFDIFCNTYILHIWGNQATNYVQILHGFFGLGSLITPLIVKPFLLPLNSTDDGSSDDVILSSYSPDDVKIQLPYLVTGILLIVVSFGFLAFFIKERNCNKLDEKNDPTTFDTTVRWKKYLGVFLVAVLADLTFGVETLVGSLAPAFAVKSNLHMTKQNGANLVTLFWTVFTFYRLVFIFLSNFIREKNLMLSNYAIIIVSIFVMVPHAAYKEVMAYLALTLLGIGFSPTFSVSLAVLQKYVNLSNRMAAFIFINGSIGESIHPWILSKFMDTKPVAFVYYLGLLSALQVAFCFFLPIICDKLFSEKKKLQTRDNLDRTASIRSSQR